MNTFPDDLLQYLRNNKLAARQKKSMRELAMEFKQTSISSAQYAANYTRRAKKIRSMVD